MKIFKTPWTQKTVYQRFLTVVYFIASEILVVALVYAGTRLKARKELDNSMGKGHFDSIDLDGKATKRDVIPGDEISVNPTVTNKRTDPMYVFIRFECTTFDDGTGANVPIYSFTPSDSTLALVDTGVDGEICYGYGTESEMTVVQLGESVSLSSMLKLVMDSDSFVAVDEENLGFKTIGCVIDTAGNWSTPQDVYDEYIADDWQ